MKRREMFLRSDPRELFSPYFIEQRIKTRSQESRCHPKDGTPKKQTRARDPTRDGELWGQIHTKPGRNHCSHEKPVKEQLKVCMGLFTRLLFTEF